MGDRESALTFTMHVAIVETDHVRITRVFIQWNLRIKDKYMYSHSIPMIRISFQVWIMDIKKGNICQKRGYNVSMVTLLI